MLLLYCKNLCLAGINPLKRVEYQEFEEMLLDIVSSVYSFLEEKHVKGRRNLIRGEKKKNGI